MSNVSAAEPESVAQPPHHDNGDGDEDGSGGDSSEEEDGEEEDEVDKESSESDDSADEANAAEIKSLRQMLQENPTDYEAHMRLISLLKMDADLTGVQQARQILSQLTPLPSEFWCEWIDDEERLARTPQELLDVRQLCERALEDGLSVPLWVRFAQISVRIHLPHLAQDDDGATDSADFTSFDSRSIDAARADVERAITACGMHLAEGGAVWDVLERLETALLRSATSASPAQHEQTQRVRAVFKRRLAISHLDLEATHARYLAWEQHADAAGEQGAEAVRAKAAAAFEEAVAAMRQRRRAEMRVAAAQRSAGAPDPWASDGGGEWEAWEQYLELEGDRDPWRTRLLYERMLAPRLPTDAATPLCYQPWLWSRYIRFLGDSLPGAKLEGQVCARAIRFCPSDATLRICRLRALEAEGAAATAVQAEFEHALSATLARDESEAQAIHAPLDGAATYANDYVRLLHAYSHYQRRRLASALSHGAAGHVAGTGDASVTAAGAATAAAAAAAKAAAAETLASVRAARDAVLAYEAAYLSVADADGGLVRFWIAVEAQLVGDAAQARALMETVFARFGQNASIWIECVVLERELEQSVDARGACGGGGGSASRRAVDGAAPFEKARKLFRRAVTVITDAHQALALHTAWTAFEATWGTLASQRAAEIRCASHWAAVCRRGDKVAAAAHEAAAEAAEAAAARASAKSESRKAKRHEAKAKKQGNQSKQAQDTQHAHGGQAASSPASHKRKDGHQVVAEAPAQKKPRSALLLHGAPTSSSGPMVPRVLKKPIHARRPTKPASDPKPPQAAAAAPAAGSDA